MNMLQFILIGLAIWTAAGFIAALFVGRLLKRIGDEAELHR